MTSIPEIFGSNVFSLAVMKERLPKKVYEEVFGPVSPSGPAICTEMGRFMTGPSILYYTHSNGSKSRPPGNQKGAAFQRLPIF